MLPLAVDPLARPAGVLALEVHQAVHRLRDGREGLDRGVADREAHVFATARLVSIGEGRGATGTEAR